MELGRPKPSDGFSVSELRRSHGQLEKQTLLLPKHHLRWSKGSSHLRSSKEKQHRLPRMLCRGLEAPDLSQAGTFGCRSVLHLGTHGLLLLFTLK